MLVYFVVCVTELKTSDVVLPSDVKRLNFVSHIWNIFIQLIDVR